MSSWRLARAIQTLREEIDAAAPNRSKASDGTIGDADHASRKSDHNPYINDSSGKGVVRAIDITHDPAGGMDAYALAELLRRLGQTGDPRIRYVISNARIASPRQGWAWRPYSGPNAHAKHTHLSVVEDAAGYDSTAPWGIAQQEDDMALSDADVDRIAAAVEKRVLGHLEFRDKVHWNPARTLLERIASKVGVTAKAGHWPGDDLPRHPRQDSP